MTDGECVGYSCRCMKCYKTIRHYYGQGCQSCGASHKEAWGDDMPYDPPTLSTTCECGAIKCRTTHAQWCPLWKRYK